MGIDYKDEVEKLSKSSKTWKPEPGVYRVAILSDPEHTQFENNETGVVTPQIKLEIEVNKEYYDWFVPIGKTMESVYGQLMKVGSLKGKLIGEGVTISVSKVSGKEGKSRNSYTIQEAKFAVQGD